MNAHNLALGRRLRQPAATDVGGRTPTATAAAADGGSTQAVQGVVDIRRLDAWRNGPKALDFSSTPLPPTDLEFANYRPGFAYALLFFFKLALRTQFPDFWRLPWRQNFFSNLLCKYVVMFQNF